MNALQEEAAVFRREKEDRVADARQQAAFFLISGIDLAEALKMRGEKKTAMLARLGRLIERERLKGARRHWSYDLNRHIALKQAYERLKRSEGMAPAVSEYASSRHMANAGGWRKHSNRRHCGLPKVRAGGPREPQKGDGSC